MPASIGWRKREEDGAIVIWDLPHGAEYAPQLSFERAKSLARVEEKWGPLCREIGAKFLLPDGWLQAMILRESGGNEKARNQERTPDNPRDDGIGLMQITSQGLKGKHTDAELFDPRLNITIGAKYISWLSALGSVRGDFPRVCAAFNAGSVKDSSKNRWGMVQTDGHCDDEVAAYNTFLFQKAEALRRAAEIAVSHQLSTQELLEGKEDPPPTPRNT